MTSRIAIIGSGMAGLSAAWMLAQRGFHVTVFEKSARPGLAAHSRDFAEFVGADSPVLGDVPSRMINRKLWPTVCKLYDQAAILTTDVESQQAFYDDEGTHFRAQLPYTAGDLIAAAIKSSHRRILDRLKFLRTVGTKTLDATPDSQLSFGEFIDRNFNSPDDASFLKRFLYPALSATVFTCPVDSLLKYPAVLVLDALQRVAGGDKLLRTVSGLSLIHI